MAGNFFSDNPDLQYHLERADLGEIVATLECGYQEALDYPAAPRNYADAKDNYRRLLLLLGAICAEDIAPTAAAAAEEGVHFADGEVTYASATVAAIERLRQADLMGAMLPREYGGLNLPQTVFQMMIEMVSRAEAGLMTVFGLQEISATIAEYGDEEMRSRLLPRFSSGDVTGAMVLTEPDAGSDLGVVQTHAVLNEETGEWRLSGVKRFITNGNADVMLVLARSEEGSQDARGLSMFELEADDSVTVRRIENKMGLHASPTCEIEFNETPARLLGRRRFGLIRYAMAMMTNRFARSRPCIACCSPCAATSRRRAPWPMRHRIGWTSSARWSTARRPASSRRRSAHGSSRLIA
jgi:alkylation response protein AidB-like acyl-CoA dehydrogenase